MKDGPETQDQRTKQMEKGKYKITKLDPIDLIGTLDVDSLGQETWVFVGGVPSGGFRAVRVRELPSLPVGAVTKVVVNSPPVTNLSDEGDLSDVPSSVSNVLMNGVYQIQDDSGRHLGRIFSNNRVEHWFTESERPHRFVRIVRERDLNMGEGAQAYRMRIEDTLGHFTYYRRVIARGQ